MIPRKTLTGKRYSAGTTTKGRWVEGAVTTLTIKASVQPTKPDTLMTLPENRRDSQSYTLYTDTKLRTVDQITGTNADRVTIDSEEYEVVSVAPWQNKILPHYGVVVSKVVAK